MVSSLAEKPIVIFLQSYLQKLTMLCSDVELAQHTFIRVLRDKIQYSLYETSIDPCFSCLLLQSCQAISDLGRDTLAHYLDQHGLAPAVFMSEPAPHFDSALVPLTGEAQGSGYVLCVKADLPPDDIYYLLAHAYGHLALGHIRKGDVYSHYDILADLRSPLGPPRRWDRVVQTQQHLWSPLTHPITPTLADSLSVEWSIPGFSGAFERLRQENVDDCACALQTFASRHGTEFLQVDFDIERDAQLFPHQKRGAAELVVRLQKLGVALLADSVGLGKTRTVATVIKLLRQHQLIKRAAVLTPTKLEYNWLVELNKLGLTVGSLGEEHVDVVIVNKDTFKRWDAMRARQEVHGCDLLVIEEAHQDMRNTDNKFHRNIRAVAFDKYGLLVTATPWNNRRGDIFAMLQPFATNRLGTAIPAHIFSCFSKGLEAGQQEFEQDSQIFHQVYHRTVLQRTRRQLRQSGDANVFYAPRRPHLINVEYTTEQHNAFASLLNKIEQLRLPYDHPAHHLTDPAASKNRLSGIHRFTLLKRAESSMRAFSISLNTFAHKAQSMYKALANLIDSEAAMAVWLRQRYQIQEDRESSFDVSSSRKGKHERMREIIEQAEREGRLQALRHLLMDDCLYEIRLIQTIQQEFHTLFERDPKLDAILQQVQHAVQAGHKVLCISQYTDTAHAVYQHVLTQPYLKHKGVGFVVGSQQLVQINGQSATREDVLSRFAPHSWMNGSKQKHKQKYSGNQVSDQIEILIGSDTLSVGQNLQDARVLLNLDLCWNPMQHEQRIGRIDRPRHRDDSAPLDIYYFLNCDLIESELQLRGTLEKRLTTTYQDTAFDDEILPGYFDMIEQFRRLREGQDANNIYVTEANAILEKIVECSARPPEAAALDSELERKAILRLQEVAQSQVNLSAGQLSDRQVVSIGRIPYEDLNGSPYSSLPIAALIAEVQFRAVDQRQHTVGKAQYQHFYVSLNEEQAVHDTAPNIAVESESLIPIVEGLLAEPSLIPLKHRHIVHLQMILLKLEVAVQQALYHRLAILKRNKQYHSQLPRKEDQEYSNADTIEARLVNVKFLI
jgi:hypothetical protein